MSRTTPSAESRAIRLLEQQGMARPRDLERHGIHRAQLQRLVAEGLLERLSRGIYALVEREHSGDLTLAIVARRVPDGIICLLTALRLHGLTTQLPHEVWIALPETARKPQLDYPKLRVARFSGAALTEGVETRRIDGVEVRLYSAAKTVADCFKYRHKIGTDVAVEALRDYLRLHRGGATALAHFARVCRVARVMQPYLEAML